MSAGDIWRRQDGLHWVEIQNRGVDPSGWRLMVPLMDLAEAPEAPPLVVTVQPWRARLHLLVGIPENRLGEAVDQLPPAQIRRLQAAVCELVTESARI